MYTGTHVAFIYVQYRFDARCADMTCKLNILNAQQTSLPLRKRLRGLASLLSSLCLVSFCQPLTSANISHHTYHVFMAYHQNDCLYPSIQWSKPSSYHSLHGVASSMTTDQSIPRPDHCMTSPSHGVHDLLSYHNFIAYQCYGLSTL